MWHMLEKITEQVNVLQSYYGGIISPERNNLKE